jgi:hypothetical protein
LQRKQCRTTREPFAEVAARDIPLHNLTSSPLRAVEAGGYRQERGAP